MDPAYYVAAGSLKARSFQMDVISNNLANSQTVGYKTERSFFSLFNKAQASTRDLPLTKFVNDGTVMAGRGVDFSQGTLRPTGKNLDLAIEGDGFLMVETPRGLQATRDGRLRIGTGGRLETFDGLPVMGKNNTPIQIDPDGGPVTITPDGTVEQGSLTQGQLDLKAYATPHALKRVGNNRYDPRGLAEATPKATVTQGYLEQSAVDMPSAMIDMIRLNRLFEMSMKVASTLSNELDANTINYIANQR
jgi:flagellar basal body rod protein FlgG